MTKEDIERLAEKIVSGSATEEEIMLYNRVCDMAETLGHGSLQLSEVEKATLEVTLKKAILRDIRKVKVYRMQWATWTAAAVVLLLLTSTAWFIVQTTRVVKPAYSRSQLSHDILPGRQGAVLTLANGRTIILDSAANGALVSDGGAEVIKKDGKIVYDVQQGDAKTAFNTMSTPVGRQYQLTLSDGTSVWLNAASSITYPAVFTGNQRTVKITGEVYFEVAHVLLRSGQKMPFTVEKGNAKIEVLGTHFNVNAYDDESAMKVTLLEGAVKVANAGSEKTIRPGQQAQLMNGNVAVENNVNLEEVMAWKNGRFLFPGTNIHQLMRQLSRWYNVRVQYEKEISDEFYAEIPRNTKLSDVLKALELTGRVHFEVRGNTIIVKP